MNHIRLTASIVLLAAALGFAACGSDAAGPDARQAAMQQVAGSYAAAESYGALSFTTTASGETIDWLAAGASIEVVLGADGTTTGRLYVPGIEEDGGDWEADLMGSWTLDDGTVHFVHEADTFVRDMPFRVKGGGLEGTATFGGETEVRVVLARR